MFGSFKKKEPGLILIDKIWMTQEAKWNGCVEELKANPGTVFIAWFDETLEQTVEVLSKENLPVTNAFIARQVCSHIVQGNNVVFTEHYPLRSKELSLFEQLHISRVQIFSALDEPIFKQYGGDKIIQMMKQLGMKETESLENKLLSNAIKKAQEKIEAKISIDHSARSQTEWLSKNFPG